MKSVFERLLHEAVTAGAVDRWMEDEHRYRFCIGSRIYRMKRDDGRAFLEALLQRQYLESLRGPHHELAS